jgi:hypothetical protein
MGMDTMMQEVGVRSLVVIFILVGSMAAQTTGSAPQLVLENESVRILRVTIPPGGELDLHESSDAAVVRLQDESATFVPKGSHAVRNNTTTGEVTDLLVEPKKHWEPEVHACAEPMKCVHETRTGNEPISWTTTLFTNGFLTAATHKVVRGGTLTSSYYSAKGSDQIVFIPFTDLRANFGSTYEPLKAGQPYISAATEVEVTGDDAEVRWFVLRLHTPTK